MKVAFDERISLCLLTEIPGQAGDDDAIFRCNTFTLLIESVLAF